MSAGTCLLTSRKFAATVIGTGCGSVCDGRRRVDHYTEQLWAEETMDRFEAEVRVKGMTVFARIDHAGGSRRGRFAAAANRAAEFSAMPNLGPR